MISEAYPEPVHLMDVELKEEKEGCGQEKEEVGENLKTLQDGEGEEKGSTNCKGTAYTFGTYINTKTVSILQTRSGFNLDYSVSVAYTLHRL